VEKFSGEPYAILLETPNRSGLASVDHQQRRGLRGKFISNLKLPFGAKILWPVYFFAMKM